MNEKQAKLLRYFIKYTHDYPLANGLRKSWKSLDHRAKRKITSWLKRVVVTLIHVADERKKYETRQKALKNSRNLEILKGFASA